jgi:hypothetical protein
MPSEPESPTNSDEASSPLAARRGPRSMVDRPLPHLHAPAPTQAVSLTGLPEGAQVRAVVGMAACGFWKLGEGSAAAVGGRAELKIALDPSATQAQGFSLYFFLDADGDGACTTETVYGSALGPSFATPLQVDLSKAVAGGSCWMMQ